MANNINAYDTTQKLATGSNDYITATAVSGNKRALDVNVAAGSISLGTVAQDYGVSSLALRVAAQLGNASGAAAFGAGATSSQTLRVVLPTDQTAIPVTQSGAWSVAQSGTWNINNVSGTVSLPTGAATAANQATEITSLQLIDNLVLSQASTTSGQQGVLGMGAATLAPPSYTDGQTNPLSLTLDGYLRTYDVEAQLQLLNVNSSLSGIDGSLFTISSHTVNLTTMGTAYVLNDAFATGRGVPMMAEYDDTGTNVPSADDRLYMGRITLNRALHVNLRDNSGAEIGTSSSPVFGRVDGTGAEGTAVGNPVTIAMQDLTTGNRLVPSTFDFLGATYQLNLNPDLALNFLQYAADGSMNCRTGSPDGTLANAVYLATDSNRNLRVVGDIAHDATDSGNPQKIGGKSTSLTSEPTAVSAAGDRVDAYFDTRGYQHVKTNAHRSTITQVFTAQAFNNVTTSANSSSFDCTRYRYLVVYVALTESGTATDIRLKAQFDRGSGNWFDWYIDQWVDLRWTTGVMPVNEMVPINQVVGTTFRIRAEATGTTAVNTITLSAWVEGIT